MRRRFRKRAEEKWDYEQTYEWLDEHKDEVLKQLQDFYDNNLADSGVISEFMVNYRCDELLRGISDYGVRLSLKEWLSFDTGSAHPSIRYENNYLYVDVWENNYADLPTDLLRYGDYDAFKDWVHDNFIEDFVPTDEAIEEAYNNVMDECERECYEEWENSFIIVEFNGDLEIIDNTDCEEIYNNIEYAKVFDIVYRNNDYIILKRNDDYYIYIYNERDYWTLEVGWKYLDDDIIYGLVLNCFDEEDYEDIIYNLVENSDKYDEEDIDEILDKYEGKYDEFVYKFDIDEVVRCVKENEYSLYEDCVLKELME